MKSFRTLNCKDVLAYIKDFNSPQNARQCRLQDTHFEVSDSIKLPTDTALLPANIYFDDDLDARGTKIEIFDNGVLGTADFSGSNLRQIGPRAHCTTLRIQNTPLKDRLLRYRKNLDLRARLLKEDHARFSEDVAILVGEPDNSLWVHPSARLPEKILEATNTTVATIGSFVLLCETHGDSVTPLFAHSRNGDDLNRNSQAEQDAFKEIACYLDASLAELRGEGLDHRWDPFSRPPAPLETPAYAPSR